MRKTQGILRSAAHSTRGGTEAHGVTFSPSVSGIAYVLVAVQSVMHVGFFATSWTAANWSPLSFTVPWNQLKFMSIECMTLILFPQVLLKLAMTKFFRAVLKIRRDDIQPKAQCSVQISSSQYTYPTHTCFVPLHNKHSVWHIFLWCPYQVTDTKFR